MGMIRAVLAVVWWASGGEAHLRVFHPIEVHTHSGSIRGEYTRIKGNDFTMFKGIPYAAPPVGSLRFRPPEEPAKWRGVMNATQYSAMCVQRTEGKMSDPDRRNSHYSEDCLYLNVFAPALFVNDTYPVIVYIHGGGFQSGGASDLSQQAILDNFVSRKIVFVSMNYRLGPLGFLSTDDKELPGNFGLLDQILALKWVQINAHEFSGDPNNVLLMGSGSGAASASILALSPLTQNLFHKLLLMSGTAFTPGMVRKIAKNATWALDEKLQCRSYNSSQLLNCFRNQLKDEILDFPRTRYDDYDEFVPTVDREEGVVPELPHLMPLSAYKHPVMIGTTKDESALKILIMDEKHINMSALTASEAEFLVDNLTRGYDGFVNHVLIANASKHQYIWTKNDPSYPHSVLQNSLLKFYSDFWYDAPASRLASAYARNGQPVFLYSFDHVSENFYDYARAFHGVDHLHLFNITPRFLNKRKDMNWMLDSRVTEIFAELISNFARYGHPTPPASGFSFNWTATDTREMSYLSITDSPQMEVGYRWHAHVFWNIYVDLLQKIDVGNELKITVLNEQLGDYQLATWMLLFCSLFFFAILVGLACYCTRKENEDEDL